MLYFRLLAEKRIQEAINDGKFDTLAYAGKPLHFADDTFVPDELKMSYKILKNSGFCPPEIEGRKEINNILDLLENSSDILDLKSKILQIRKLETILFSLQSQGKTITTYNDEYYQKILIKIQLLKKQYIE